MGIAMKRSVVLITAIIVVVVVVVAILVSPPKTHTYRLLHQLQ